MNTAEFRNRVAADPTWHPGFDTITTEFQRLYPGQEPEWYHHAIPPSLGGDCYIEEFAKFQSPAGYQHIVTFGMTELGIEEEALGGEFSRWGYEMTLKLPDTSADWWWTINLLEFFARYTYESGNWFKPYATIRLNGSPIIEDDGCTITAFVTAPDTEARTQHGIYGKTAFVQLVRVTETEIQHLDGLPEEEVKAFITTVQADNPHLVTDLFRTKEYLEYRAD